MGWAAGLAPHLSANTWERLKFQLAAALPKRNVAAQELSYQRLAQKQSLSDALKIYDPRYRGQVQVAYTSFTAENGRRAGSDLGYGLRVLKRLELGAKVIEVKEFWPVDRYSGRLFRPEELRIKTRVEGGERGGEGSEGQYLFDRVHLAWGPGRNEVTVHRRTLYDSLGNLRQVRSPVSVPYSCMGCHQSDSGLRKAFAKDITTQESIIQPAYYELPKKEMDGLKEYLGFLKKVYRDSTLVESAQRTLEAGGAIWPEGIAKALRDVVANDTVSWLKDDTRVAEPNFELLLRQGYYPGPFQQNIYRDALEQVFEGKYRWWDPETVIP